MKVIVALTKQWNGLPQEAVTVPAVNVFQNRQDKLGSTCLPITLTKPEMNISIDGIDQQAYGLLIRTYSKFQVK